MRLGVLLALSLLAAPFARGDDSSMNEGAYGPEPRGATAGAESIVRMESEKITVRFGREKSEVIARFVFRSGKPNAPARQLVGFPDFGAAYEEAHRRDPKDQASWQPHENIAGPIEDLHTFVDGQEVASKLDYGFIIDDEAVGWKPGTPKDGTLMAWHVIWVSFLAGKEVVIERRYRVPNGKIVYGITKFDYTTATGAAWRGTIGRLDVDVILDGWKVSDLAWKDGGKKQVFDENAYSSPDKREWTILLPTRLQFTWNDFEPRTDKDRRGFGLVTVGTEKPDRAR